jgi:hypothetical protein
MKRRVAVGTMVIAGVVLLAAGALAGSARTARRPDLGGHWRLDHQKVSVRTSDSGSGGGPPGGSGGAGGGPPGGGGGFGGGPPGGGGGFGGGPPGGGGGAGGGPPGDNGSSGGGKGRSGSGGPPGAGGEGGPGGMAPPSTLPDRLQVSMAEDGVTFTDPSGAVRERITLGDGPRDRATGVQVLSGTWKGQKLEASGNDGDRTIRQTLTLKKKGTLLVVRTRVQSSGNGPGFDTRRYYQRESGQ